MKTLHKDVTARIALCSIIAFSSPCHAAGAKKNMENLWGDASSGKEYSFFNKDPWRTVTLVVADRFLVKQGLLTGEPTLQAPVTREKFVPAR